MIQISKADCMDELQNIEPDSFDLVIVDPPYLFDGVRELQRLCWSAARFGLIWIDPIVWSFEEWPRCAASLLWHSTDGSVSVKCKGEYGTMPWRYYSEFGILLGYSCSSHEIDIEGHAGAKPVSAMKEILGGVGCDGYLSILDPMCGTGSSLIAAQELGFTKMVGFDINYEEE